MFVPDLHAAAQYPKQVRDDIAGEDAGIVAFQAVQDFAPNGHDALKLGVPALLAGAQSGVALHNVQFPPFGVLAPAVHELLYPVGQVHVPRQVLLDGLAGALGLFPGALVDQDLVNDPLRFHAVFRKVDFQLFLKEGRHGLLNEPVGDGLFCLVLIGGLGGEAVGHQDQAVGDVLEHDFGLIALVLALFLDLVVHSRDKGGPGRFVRGAAVLQPGGVVVIFNPVDLRGEAEGGGQLHLVLLLVRPVPAPALGLDEHGGGQGRLPGDLCHIVPDAVLVQVLGGFKAVFPLHFQHEPDPGVHHRLAAEHIVEVFLGDVHIREHLDVRLEADGGARLFPVGVLDEQFPALLPHGFALAEVEGIFLPVPADGHIHVLGGILGGAGAQAVQAQRKLVVLPLLVAVFAAGVQLAEHQLPVIPFFIGVPVQGAAPAEVLHLNGAVGKGCQGDGVTVALPGLVNGVGQDLKDCVFAALQSVGAENHPRAFPHPVRTFQL